jgi:hypothetical protein
MSDDANKFLELEICEEFGYARNGRDGENAGVGKACDSRIWCGVCGFLPPDFSMSTTSIMTTPCTTRRLYYLRHALIAISYPGYIGQALHVSETGSFQVLCVLFLVAAVLILES